MVAPEDVHLGWVLYLVREEEADRFDALSSPVNVISKEEVAGLGWQSPVFEQPEHIIILSMDISTDLERSGDLEEHGLLHEDILNNSDEAEYLLFFECD
jgi:hypothetical protein